MNPAPGKRGDGRVPWQFGTAEHRWYGFGRYYAMFPPSFVDAAIRFLTGKGEAVLDPFCGRGIAPFAATAAGRRGFGVDIHPVAWLFAAAKTAPAPRPEELYRRLEEVAKARRSADRRGQSRFERMAWCPDVRAFLRAARRELDWRDSMIDRTLMAFLVLHMQDKRGAGLSNNLWPTIACSPEYAIRWWTKHSLKRAPVVDPVRFLEDRIARRYRFGIPGRTAGCVVLGDAATVLREWRRLDAGLIITSPPYNDVTDYWNDHWLRLWMLGYKMKKEWKRSARYDNRRSYRALLRRVFREARRHVLEDAAVLVRSDQRERTAATCIEVLRETWPHRQLFASRSEAPFNGVSVHHGKGGRKAKEIDLLIPRARSRDWWTDRGFRRVEEVSGRAEDA